MTPQKNAWIIFGIGILFISVELVLPDLVREYTVEIPLQNIGTITIVGTFGFTITILSAIKLLGFLPTWEQLLPKNN